jgi:DNA-binding MarR family transcriptional regulator
VERRQVELVGYLVWRLGTTWRTEVDRVLSPIGLTHAQFALLASLSGMSQAGEQPSQRELADWTGLEAIYVSKLAKALEQSGMLTRSQNPKDPRAVQLALTPKGTERVQEADARVQKLLGELIAPLGGLHSRENEQFVAMLCALLDRTPYQGQPDNVRE